MNTEKSIKILVLTLEPLGLNYGGTLQAYALQKALESVLNREITTHNKSNIIGKTYNFIIISIKIGVDLILKNASPILRCRIPQIIQSKNVESFVKENIITSSTSLYGSILSTKKYNAIVVGSDQVWRKEYVNVLRYLLDFTSSMKIKRISYAASFGKDNINDYGKDLIQKSKVLANKFDAISVRESSGIDICKRYWGVDALQHIDPTFLLHRREYSNLIEKEIDTEINGILTYILDETHGKNDIIKIVKNTLNLEVFNIAPPLPKKYRYLVFHPNRFAWPSVSTWLQGFRDSKFVVTDSFHGCVFSIIFNKPFIAIGNEARGLSRFTSLLKLFNLEDRLISNESEITKDLINKKIDWVRVNKIIKREQKRSFEYLNKHLNSI